MVLPSALDAGDDLVVQVDVRDRAFVPVDGAEVEVRLTTPAGLTSPLAVRTTGQGRASAIGVVTAPGLYRVQVDARRNGSSLGTLPTLCTRVLPRRTARDERVL